MAAKHPEMESLLECCICLGECQDPRVLPCLHSLCRHCLEDHIQSSAQGGQYKCPACRHHCEIPPGGASGVPKNFFINNLRDILQRQTGQAKEGTSVAEIKSTAEHSQPECSNKHLGKVTHTCVTVFCVECSKYLCSNCEDWHNVLISDSHELQPVEKVAATGRQDIKQRRHKPKCDQHSSLHNDIYCDTCHIPMCVRCCLFKHQHHNYRELDDLTEESAEKLEKLTETAEKRYSVLDKHLKMLDVTQENMDMDAEKAYREVHEAADELRDFVTQREQALVQEIKNTHAVAATELKATYKETELHKASVQSLLSYIQALQKAGDISDQVVHIPGLEEQLRQQETLPLKSVSLTVDFKRNTANMSSVNALLGSLSKEQTVDRPVSLADDEKLKLGSPQLTLTSAISYTCAGITKLDDCLCVVGWVQPHLWMHNLKSNSSNQQTLTGVQAVGMTTAGSNNNTLIIADKGKKLHFITIDPHTMTINNQLTKDISFEPRRIACDNATERLIIANKTDNQIVLCSKNGDIEQTITVKTQLSHMMCALPTADEGYIVVDCASPGRLHWVNQSGDVTHTYGTDAGENLNCPWHLLQDSQGHLLVADYYNHCIRLIRNQKFSHDLITQKEGLQYPSCVWLDKTDSTLYVGYTSSDYKLSMYKWPFKPATPTGADTLSKHFKLCLNLTRYQ